MRHEFNIWGICSVAALVALACGSSSDDQLFSGEPGAGAGGTSSGGTVSATGGATASGGNAGSGGITSDGGSQSGGTSSGGTAATGGTPAAGGSPTDAGALDSSAGGVASDAGGGAGGGTGGTGGEAGVRNDAGGADGPQGGPGAGLVECGGEPCDLVQGEFCCASAADGTAECRSSGDECNDAPIRCDADDDCSRGETCCGIRTDSNVYTAFECRTNCDSGDTPIHCSKTSDCASGEVCCGERILEGSGSGTFGSTTYVNIECASTCEDRTVDAVVLRAIVMCTSSEECAEQPAGPDCVDSVVLPPAVHVCN